MCRGLSNRNTNNYLGEFAFAKIAVDCVSAQAYIGDMNKLTPAKRAAVVAALVEGNSIRANVRMTGIAKTP